MTKFLLAVRKAYDTKRIAFIIAFCAVAVFLYFAPFSTRLSSLFSKVLYASSTIDLCKTTMENGFLAESDFVATCIDIAVSLPLFVLAIGGIISAIKARWSVALACPVAIYAMHTACAYVVVMGRMGMFNAADKVYSASYIIVALLVILAVALILLALYLPLKEPRPREPRKRKPSKAERIAQLEARVQELEKESRD